MYSPVSSAGLSSGGLVSPSFLQSLSTLVLEDAYHEGALSHKGSHGMNGCTTKTRMKLVSLTSAVGAWNKKIQATRAHCHDRTRPGLARAGSQRPNLEVFLVISPPVGGRTPRPG